MLNTLAVRYYNSRPPIVVTLLFVIAYAYY